MKIGKNSHISDKAIIRGNVVIGDDVTVGDHAILEGCIRIGKGTTIDHGVVVRGRVKIGKNNWIYPHGVIGTGPQDGSFQEKSVEDSMKRTGEIKIGDNNVIREFVSIHLPTVKKKTEIGSNCYIMSYCHLAHDVKIHDHVAMATMIVTGGFTEICNNAYIGSGNHIHQYCRIGAYVMLGMGNAISKDVLPFSLINNRRFTRINHVGLLRNKIKKSDVSKIENLYKNEFPDIKSSTWYEKEIHKFLKKSTRGIYVPAFNQKYAKT